MASVKCKICNITMTGSLKVFQGHCQGKNHIKLLPSFVTVKAPFTIDKVNDIHQYFAKFGTLTTYTVRIGGGSVSIDYYFENCNTYTAIIQQEHWLFNQKLEISWIQNNLNISHNNLVPETAASHAEPPATAMINLDRSQSTDSKKPNQSTKLAPLKKAETTDAYMEESRLAVVNSVKEGGRTFAQQVAILQSSLQTTNEAKMEKNRKLIQTHLRLTLVTLFPQHEINFFGPSITGLDLRGNNFDIYVGNVRHRGKSEVNIIKAIRNLLHKSKEFCDVIVLSQKMDPVIKCMHIKTQICCSLNIWNKLPVENSKLIKYYLTLDEKLFPLMIIIKLWNECYRLRKVFSGYAVYLMVIFYLQQEPYKLPSIVDLQKDCPANIEDEWNCAFSTPASEYPALRDESLLNLVAGFFRFYRNFDYVAHVISPYLGTAVKKVAFMKPFDLPDDAYHQYKKQNKLLRVNSGISIQDPFEHSRNVSALIPLKFVGSFAILCKIAGEYTRLGETDLLHTLLTKCWRAPMHQVCFTIDKSDDEKTDKEWFDFVKTFTIRVLKEVLNCSVTEISNSVDTQVLKCMTQNNIWDNRIDVMKTLETQLPPEINDFEREIAVVQNVLNNSPGRLVTRFLVTVVLWSDPSRIEYILQCKERSVKMYFHLAHYFRIKFPTWLKIVEVCEKQTVFEDVPNSVENTKPVEIKTEDKIVDDSNAYRNSSLCKQVGTSTDSRQLHATDTNAQDNEEMPVKDEETKHTEEEEMDVPPDFFDDFSNQVFMDGLDIIDAWDEDSGKLLEEVDEEKKTSKESYRESTKKRQHHRSKSRSPVKRRKRSGSFGRRPRSRSRSREKLRSDIRRDPEKTKRDIHKDKMKCAKDKEQKLVTDKLKIVETGLVPPRTEMEENSATMKEKRRPAGDGIEKVRSEREKRNSGCSASKESTRKATRHSRSPVYRYRNRVESDHRRRRASSVDSNASERESRIRSRRKRSRSRSRDSPSRLKPRQDDKPKKKTFLEEIRDKLEEVRPVPVPPPHPIPAPVPAPRHFFPQPTVQHQQYHLRCILGDANPIAVGQTKVNNPLAKAAGSVVSVPQVSMNLTPQVPIVPELPVVQQNTSSSPSLTGRNETSVKQTGRNSKQTKDHIDKLFAEKKISLSDFLTVAAKCEVQSSSPDQVQKKIKVISRCQHAIKAMSEDPKFTGILSVKPSPEAKKKSEMKYQSPLRRIPIVRLQFTTPSKFPEEMDTFAVALDEILQKVGVSKATIDLEEVADVSSKNVGNSLADPADQNTTALALKASLLNSKTISEVAGCEECRKRKLKKFVDVGSQCADGKETVGEEELSPAKRLLKNKSTAHLTQAQLSGKDKKKKKAVEKGEVRIIPTDVSKKVEKKVESPEIVIDNTNGKVKKARISGAGDYRKLLGDRQSNKLDFEEKFECREKGRPSLKFEDPRESVGHRYGGTKPIHYPRHFLDGGEPGLPRMNQLREEQEDFNQLFRDRNPNRSGPRH